MGKKTQQNSLNIDVSKVKIQDPKHVLLLPADMSLSLSPMRYTQVSVCSNEEHKSSIYTLYVT